MWSRKKVVVGVIFAVSVSLMTVSLLEAQERFLTRHMVKSKHNTKVNVRGTDANDVAVVKNIETAVLVEIHQDGRADDRMTKQSVAKLKDLENEYEMSNNDKPNGDIENTREKEWRKIHEGKNYIHKLKDLNEEDRLMNIDPPQEDSKLHFNKQKAFRDDVIYDVARSRDHNGDKDASLVELIHKAARKIKKRRNRKKKIDETMRSLAYEDIDAIAEFITNHETSNNYTFMQDNQHVRNCITGKILGDVPDDFDLEPFDIALKRPRGRTNDEMTSFRDIYNERRWGTNWPGTGKDGTSASGRGANIHWTQEVTATLHVLINQLKAVLNKDHISILDVPCGDMTWMGRFLQTRDDVKYTGVDIVPELIAKHKMAFRGTPYKFFTANILETGFTQEYDIIFNRMMLQHLFNADIANFLKLASESGSKYLLTTTFPHHEVNKDLVIDSDNPGRFRLVNLEVPPYSLPPPICIQHDGPPNDFVRVHHFIALWKLPLHRVALCKEPWAMYLKGSKELLYSCVQWGYRQP